VFAPEAYHFTGWRHNVAAGGGTGRSKHNDPWRSKIGHDMSDLRMIGHFIVDIPKYAAEIHAETNRLDWPLYARFGHFMIDSAGCEK
jgi:hypothetical protein